MDRFLVHDGLNERDYEFRRLVPSVVEIGILAIIAAALVGGRLLYCGVSAGPFQVCMRTGSADIPSNLLFASVALFGLWAGARIALRLGNRGVGYLAVAAAALGLSVLLLLLGFVPAAGGTR